MIRTFLNYYIIKVPFKNVMNGLQRVPEFDKWLEKHKSISVGAISYREHVELWSINKYDILYAKITWR